MTTVSAPGIPCTAPDPYPLRVAAMKDYPFFLAQVMKNPAINSKHGFHRRLAEFIARPVRRRKPIHLALCPRGGLKSTFGNIDHCIWLLLNDPEQRILMMHGLDEKAVEYVGEVQDKIAGTGECSGILRWIAPDVFGKDPAKDLRLEKGLLTVKRRHHDKTPSLYATGERSSGAGFHHTRYKFDDLVNDANYQTPAARNFTIERFKVVMGTRRSDDSPVDIIDTIYDPEDLTQWVQQPENGLLPFLDKFEETCWYTGPREDGNGNYAPGEESFWPEVKSKTFLLQQQALLGPAQFGQQYLLVPATHGAKMFKEEWLRRYPPLADEAGNPLLPGAGVDEEPHHWRVDMALDAVAGSKDPGVKDRACILIGARSETGELRLLDVYYDRPDGADWYETVHRFYCRWRPRSMVMEKIGVSAPLYEALLEDGKRRDVRYPLHESPRKRGGSGYDAKTRRAEAVQAFVARGELFVPEGELWEPPLYELKRYAYGVKNQVDDFLDCLYDLWSLPPPPAPEKIQRTEAAWNVGRGSAPLPGTLLRPQFGVRELSRRARAR